MKKVILLTVLVAMVFCSVAQAARFPGEQFTYTGRGNDRNSSYNRALRVAIYQMKAKGYTDMTIFESTWVKHNTIFVCTLTVRGIK